LLICAFFVLDDLLERIVGVAGPSMLILYAASVGEAAVLGSQHRIRPSP
jgi:hypothetical protein